MAARFFKELFNKKLKCDRVEHNLKPYRRQGYYPGGFNAVVTNITQEGKKCKRCGHLEPEWETVKETGIQSFSAPTPLYDKIHEHTKSNPYWMKYWWV